VISMLVRSALQLLLWFVLAIAPLTATAVGRNAVPSNNAELQAELEEYISGLNGMYGVAAVSLDDGSGVFVNDETLFPTASMYKLLVMYRVFQAIEAGSLSPEDYLTITSDDFAGGEDGIFVPDDTVTVGRALEAMIAESNNASAYALTRAVGGWGMVASAAEELGMYSTYMEEDFVSTPNDLAHFFRLLAERSLVSPSASEQMIDLLLEQKSYDRLPALLPEGVQVAHKTGELPGVRNDGGIVRGFGGRYVVVVMSQQGDPDEQVPAEAEISRMVYDYYGE